MFAFASPNSDSLRVGKVSKHGAFLENPERQMNNPLSSEGKDKAHKGYAENSGERFFGKLIH